MSAQALQLPDGPDDLLSQLRVLTAGQLAGTSLIVNPGDPIGGGPPCAIGECPRPSQANQLCITHRDRWRAAGHPALTSWAGGRPLGVATIDLWGLPETLRLELTYGILCANADPRPPTITLHRLRRLIIGLAEAGVASLLEPDEQNWPGAYRDGRTTGAIQVPFLIFTIDRLDQLTGRTGPDHEFTRDAWRLRRLGFQAPVAGWTFKFTGIAQPWLKDATKRFIRWRIATGHSPSGMSRDVLTLTRLSTALTATAGPDATVEQLTRPVIERFMLLLRDFGLTDNGRGIALSSASAFFNAVRQHDWLPTLPTQTAIYPDDFPRRQHVAGRAVPEFVMAQIENPHNLAKIPDPGRRLLITVLIQTGLRLGDAARLGLDCVVSDQQQAPYLRYHNHKMKRDALVPIGVELAAAINAHAKTMTQNGSHLLFPRGEGPQDSRSALTNGMAATSLRNWLADCAFHDEQGQSVHLTAHQFRHTLATRLINKDVPQEVVRKILDHSSTQMTAHYARLHDTTVRKHWERARKVTIDGQPVLISQDSPLADGVWMKHHLAKATTSLPNGYCGLPLQQSCPHANACLTCPVFITTPEFLGQHREQLAHTELVLAGARKNGHLRLIEMNERIAANLTTIITTLETENTAGDSEVNDAR